MSHAPPAQPAAAPVYYLYLDETGSRHLDKLAKTANQHPTWFALGGVLVLDAELATCKAMHAAFCASWPALSLPLHLTDMRARRKHFSWLEKLDGGEQARFWSEYHAFLAGLPAVGMACVVHRPGYLARGYGSRPGDSKWDLCRTAFDIVVERSAKYAAAKGARLKVVFERSDKRTDQLMKGYFAVLKAGRGLQFDAGRSAIYAPMAADELSRTLIDIEPKPKIATLLQIADSYVYGIAKGRYEPSFTLFDTVSNAGRLMDAHVADPATEGIKYSCFDGI